MHALADARCGAWMHSHHQELQPASTILLLLPRTNTLEWRINRHTDGRSLAYAADFYMAVQT
jgi:hypothetical protein